MSASHTGSATSATRRAVVGGGTTAVRTDRGQSHRTAVGAFVFLQDVHA